MIVERYCFLKWTTRYRRLNYRCLSSLNLWSTPLTTEIKHQIEDRWKDEVESSYNISFDNSKETYYVLSMFPYPSGSLHMGHVRVYTTSDVIARFHRMNNRNVIHPIGWDAFGLPAENAAIEHKVSPKEWTYSNIENMKVQLKNMRLSFDWDREIATCHPEYYRWTQELFLKLYDSGLVYRKMAHVNWDPIDQTVLADEQVDENGCSWRSGAKVESRYLRQWYIRTTRFSKDLQDELKSDALQDWGDVIKIQKFWIGQCNGVVFDFKIINGAFDDVVTLWTDMPQYITDAKFAAITEDHYLAKTAGVTLSEDPVKLNITLQNPLTKEHIPVFVTRQIPFIMFTDSYLGIPGASEVATNFAKKYNIEYGPLTETNENSVRENCEKAQKLNAGGYWTSAKLRDWLVSRQRYWGTPIPIIHCEKCGCQPVPRKDLPIVLPDLTEIVQKGISHLSKISEWVNTTCPQCQGPATRETDTMDTFVDSSWYFLRYLDPRNTTKMFDEDKVKKVYPINLYIGGKEHANLHLFYARFITHFLHSQNLLSEKEPFKRLLVQGMIMGRAFKKRDTGEYIPSSCVTQLDYENKEAIEKSSGSVVEITWEKMSKSKLNGVLPAEAIKEYGIDTTRLLVLADVAPTSQRLWDSRTFPGVLNWQHRVWITMRDFLYRRINTVREISEEEFQKFEKFIEDARNYHLRTITYSMWAAQQHQLAISKQIGLTTCMRRCPPALFASSLEFEKTLAAQIITLAPIAPHFACELWSGFVSAPNRLNQGPEILWDQSVFKQPWPDVDRNYNLDIQCNINGMRVFVLKMPRYQMDKLTDEEAINIVLDQPRVKELIADQQLEDISCIICPGYKTIVKVTISNDMNETLKEATKKVDKFQFKE